MQRQHRDSKIIAAAIRGTSVGGDTKGRRVQKYGDYQTYITVTGLGKPGERAKGKII